MKIYWNITQTVKSAAAQPMIDNGKAYECGISIPNHFSLVRIQLFQHHAGVAQRLVRQPSKLRMTVRFRSPAPSNFARLAQR